MRRHPRLKLRVRDVLRRVPGRRAYAVRECVVIVVVIAAVTVTTTATPVKIGRIGRHCIGKFGYGMLGFRDGFREFMILNLATIN